MRVLAQSFFYRSVVYETIGTELSVFELDDSARGNLSLLSHLNNLHRPIIVLLIIFLYPGLDL